MCVLCVYRDTRSDQEGERALVHIEGKAGKNYSFRTVWSNVFFNVSVTKEACFKKVAVEHKESNLHKT